MSFIFAKLFLVLAVAIVQIYSHNFYAEVDNGTKLPKAYVEAIKILLEPENVEKFVVFSSPDEEYMFVTLTQPIIQAFLHPNHGHRGHSHIHDRFDVAVAVLMDFWRKTCPGFLDRVRKAGVDDTIAAWKSYSELKQHFRPNFQPGVYKEELYNHHPDDEAAVYYYGFTSGLSVQALEYFSITVTGMELSREMVIFLAFAWNGKENLPAYKNLLTEPSIDDDVSKILKFGFAPAVGPDGEPANE